MRTILHATDFSPASAKAFDTACDLARSQPSRLVLLHVLTPPSPFTNGRPPSWKQLEAGARHAAERRLGALVEKARRAGIRAQERLVDGEPAVAILRAARRDSADVIVIGTHGRSALGRWFMGSVASRLLQTSTRPVLTVRGRDGQR
jgi:nucleotide-binding universal stress UspA family protein